MYLTLWCLFVNQRGWRDEATEQQDYIGILMSRQSCSLLLGCWEQNCIRLAASHTTEHHGGREIERKLNKVKHYWAEISDILTIDHLTIDHLTINYLTMCCLTINHLTIECIFDYGPSDYPLPDYQWPNYQLQEYWPPDYRMPDNPFPDYQWSTVNWRNNDHQTIGSLTIDSLIFLFLPFIHYCCTVWCLISNEIKLEKSLGAGIIFKILIILMNAFLK